MPTPAIPTAPFDPSKTIIPRKTCVRFKRKQYALTGTAADEVLACAGHPLVDGDQFYLEVTSGLTGLTTATTYFARDVVAGVSLKAALTAGGAVVLLTADGVGTLRPVIEIPGKVSNYGRSGEFTVREVPDDEGILQADRRVQTKREQTFNHESEEPKACAKIFDDQGLAGDLTEGLAQIFIIDGDDADGVCALISNEFKATWEIEGGLNLAFGEVSKVPIKISAKQKVTLTPDGAVA